MKAGELFKLHPDPFADALESNNVRIALFRGVTNAEEIRQLLHDRKLDCSLIKAELIMEVFQVLAAVNRALHSLNNGRLTTDSIHSEIVYSLSPTRNISDSLSTFGISDESGNVLVVVYDDAKGKKMAAVAGKIDGRPADLEQLQNIHDYELIKQVYHVREPELNKASISDAIVSRIVAKDFAA